MNTLRSPFTLAALSVLAVSANSCTTGSGSMDSVTVSDSAGVQIVQLAEDAWERADRLVLSSTPDLSIGAQEGPDDEILYRVSGGLLLNDGHMAILNGGSRELRYYGTDGALDGSQGREGEGPGEYRQPVGLWLLSGDTVVVWDARLLRATFVGPDADVVRETPIPGRPRATDVVGAFADGSLVVFRQRMAEEQESVDQQFQGYYSRYSASGDSLNALGVFPWWRMITTPPAEGAGGMQMVESGPPIFDAVTEVAATADGLWVGTTKQDEVFRIDTMGEVVRIVRWVGPDRTVTDAAKEAYYDELRERLAASAAPGEAREPSRGRPFAEAFPSHGELVGREDGGLWMKEFRRPGSEPSNRWRILGPTGLPEGLIDLPPSADVLWAGSDQVLLLEKDELDVEYVRLYTLASRN